MSKWIRPVAYISFWPFLVFWTFKSQSVSLAVGLAIILGIPAGLAAWSLPEKLRRQ